MVKTKIIATLGPSASRMSVLRRMIRAGMDVVRLNFSHGSLKEHTSRIRLVHRLNAALHRHVRMLGDLQGPRIRIGGLAGHEPLELKKGKIFWLTQKDIAGVGDIASFDYEGSLKAIRRGQPIYIDDGRIYLKTLSVGLKTIKTEVVLGGSLKERKGINMPGVPLNFGGISSEDKKDIEFCVKMKIDFIAQSFVRTARDVLDVQKSLKGRLPGCRVVAKIENREGIENIDTILKAADGIMIARGDMGVCVPIYEIPMIQKMIIRKCNAAGKFVITATQMLEHMTQERIPTRAEVTDVANAVLDGTDFAMLSAETAVGLYPVEAVDMMNKIIKFTEESRKKLKY